MSESTRRRTASSSRLCTRSRAVRREAGEADGRRCLQRLRDLGPQPQHVPVERAVLTDRAVREAADLIEPEHAAAQVADDRPSAFSAEIEREERLTHDVT